MMNRFGDRLALWLVRLRVAPEGLPNWVYRDVLLGFVFLWAAIITVVLLVGGKYGFTLAASATVTVATFTLARAKRALIGGLLGFAALRFALAFLLTQRSLALVGALVCGCAAWLLLQIERWHSE
jgi:hypothetical protein